MRINSESSTNNTYSNNFANEVMLNVKVDGSDIESNYDEEQRNQTKSKPITTLNSFYTYSMCFLISVIVGYSFTSFNLIVDYGLENYSADFFKEQHSLFRNLCPAFLYVGSSIGTISMLMIKKYSHLKTIQLSIFLFFVGYNLQMVYPHILLIFATRFLIGIASGICCMVIPQVLYSSCREGIRGMITSFFPFFVMIGLTAAVALASYITPSTIYYFNNIPILILMLSFLCSFWTYKLEEAQKETNLIETCKFMFRSEALKSTVSVILSHLFQKLTGVDLIGNFAASLFEGDENAQIKSLSPLITAAVVNLITGFLPDMFGRKLPIVVNLALLCLVTLSMGILGTNVWGLISFTVLYNGGLGAIPYYYQIETVPIRYNTAINEIGAIANILMALFVALFAAFLFSSTNTTLWYTFSALSLLGSIIMGITMPETKGTPIEKRDFIKTWFNFSFKNKNLE